MMALSPMPVRSDKITFGLLTILLIASIGNGQTIQLAEFATGVQTICLRDDPFDPVFKISAGINPANFSLQSCLSSCAKLDYQFAGVQEAKYCLCSNDAANITVAVDAPSACNQTCPYGSSSMKCGGSVSFVTSAYKTSNYKTTNVAYPIEVAVNGTVTNTTTATQFGDAKGLAIFENGSPAVSGLVYTVQMGDGMPPRSLSSNVTTALVFPRSAAQRIAVCGEWLGSVKRNPILARSLIKVNEAAGGSPPPLLKSFGCNSTDTVVDTNLGVRCRATVSPLATGVTSMTFVVKTLNFPLGHWAPWTGTTLTSSDTGYAQAQTSVTTTVASGTRRTSQAYAGWNGVDVKPRSGYFYASNAAFTIAASRSPLQKYVALDILIQKSTNADATIVLTMKNRTCSSGNRLPGTQSCAPAGTFNETTQSCFREINADIGYCTDSLTGATTATPSNTGAFTATFTIPAAETGQMIKSFTWPMTGNALLSYDTFEVQTTGLSVAYRTRRGSEEADTSSVTDAVYVARLISQFPEHSYDFKVPCQRDIFTQVNAQFTVSQTRSDGSLANESSTLLAWDCQIPISGTVSVQLNTSVVAVNEPIGYTITVTKGSPITVVVTGTAAGTNVTKWLKDSSTSLTQTFSYPTAVDFTYVRATTYNLFNIYNGVPQLVSVDGNGNGFEVQWPVKRNWVLSIPTTTSAIYVDPPFVEFTLEYVGPAGERPSNATAVFSYGDGSTTPAPADDPNPVPINASKFTHKHIYVAGYYNVSVNISNKVSSVVFPLTMGGVAVSNISIWTPIRNVSASFLYNPSGDGTTLTQGNGANFLDFPQGQNITITPSVQTGFVKHYAILDGNNTEMGRVLPPDPNFPNSNLMSFLWITPAEGTHNITIQACNVKEGCIVSSGSTFSPTVSGKLSGLVINDYGLIKPPGEPKEFLLKFTSLGGSPCVLIDWGDSSLFEGYGAKDTCKISPTSTYATYIGNVTLTNPFKVNHTYLAEGVQTMSVLAWNPISSVTVTMVVISMNISCISPKASIVDGGTVKEFKRSLQAIFDGTYTLNCSSSVEARVQWALTRLNESDGSLLTTYDLVKDVTSWNRTQLVLPSLYLPYGYYQLQFTVFLTGSPVYEKFPIQASAYAYFRIIKSPLVCVVFDGALSKILKGAKDFALLKPGFLSYDPDDPDLTYSNDRISYQYACSRFGEPSGINSSRVINVPRAGYTKPTNDSGGCYGNGSAKLNITTLDFSVDTSLFYKTNETYRITVNMTRDDRSTISFLDIEIMAAGLTPLEVGIACSPTLSCTPPTINGILISLDNNTFLAVGSCTKGCDEFSKLKYSWEVMIDKGAAGKDLITSANASTMVPLGMQNADIQLAADFFKRLFADSPDWKFILRLNVKDLQTGVNGFSDLYLRVNRGPAGGKCSCDASSFPYISLKTTIRCTCEGWYDPDGIGIKSYQFVTRRLDITDRVEQFITDPAAKPDVSLAPVPGNHSISCTITDSTGAITTVSVPINFASKGISNSWFAISAPTATQMAEMEADGTIKLILNANPALTEMVSNIKLAVMQETLTASLIAGSTVELDKTSSGGGATGTSGSTSTSAAAAAASAVIDNMSATLTKAATSIVQGNNLATPAQVSSAANSISTLFTGVASSPAAAPAASPALVDAAGDIFKSIGASLDSKSAVFSGSALKSLASAALTTISTIGTLASTSTGCELKPPKPDFSMCPADQRKKVPYDPPVPAPVGASVPADPEVEKCCLVLQEKNRAVGSTTTGILETTTKVLTLSVDQMPVGKSSSFSPSPGTTVRMEKMDAASMGGAKIDTPGASLELPKDFSSSLPTGSGAVGFATVVMASNPVTGEGTEAGRIGDESGVLSFDVISQGEKIKVENMTKGITMKMARKYTPEMAAKAADSLTCTNASTVANRTYFEKVIYSTIEPSASSETALVEIRMKDYSTPPPNLYIFVGRPLKPSLIEGYHQPEHVKRVADLELEDDFYQYLAVWKNQSEATGPIHVGVFELKDGLTPDLVVAKSNWNNLDTFFKDQVSKDYCIRVTDGGISFFDGKSWAPGGMRVKKVTKTEIVFETTHLSTFGSGMFVKPNAIDFSSVFAKAGFEDNLTIYLTLIITFSVYLVLVIWARMKDKKDVQMLGALPLPDNNPEDKYIYEILVITGDQNSAATQSQVSMILSGDRDETDVRSFGKPEEAPRPFFIKGGTDAFVMTVPRPLGDLLYLRMWHDCSGKGTMCSWFCNSVSVRDVQDGKEYDFVVNQWLSPTDGDGECDRLVPVASEQDKKQFKYLFNSQKSKNLRDGHLWFSVFTRPPRSRFTRVQRVSTCMALLYLSMLANAMWYGTVPEKPGDGAFKFGPFVVSQEQIGVGVMSNLVVLPPSILIIFLFRKSRPRKLRTSRIDAALRKQRRRRLDGTGKGVLPRTRKFTLPWWCQIIAWILCIACIGVSIFFLWAYGVTFGNDKCTKWISSLMISFFSSILLVQPLKVMIIAVMMSAICKIEPEDDDADADEEDPTLQWDESFLVEASVKPKTTVKRRRLEDTDELAAVREKRLKEMKIWHTIKELIFYTLYIFIIVTISNNNRDPNASLLRRSMVNTFITSNKFNKTDQYPQVTEMGEYWKWVDGTLVPRLRAREWYNGQRPFGLQGFLDDYNNRLIGYALIRQIRAKPDSCIVHKKMREMNFTRCAGLSEVDDEDQDDYCSGWRRPGPTVADADCQWPEFKYVSQGKFESLPHEGRLDSYSGGGYAFMFQGRAKDITDRLEQLKKSQWLDTYTRAIFVEFSTYNAQVNLFTIAKITVEAIPGGGLVPAWRFDGVRLMRDMQGFGLVSVVCEAAFVVFTIYFTVVAVRAMCRDRAEFFKSYWSYVEMIQILMSYMAIVVYVLRMQLTSKVLEKFEETFGNAYIPMQYVGLIDELFGYFISFLFFAAMLSLLKLLRFNRNIGLLSHTMKICFDELTGFGLVFLIFLMAFVLMFQMLLGLHLAEWKTVAACLETSVAIFLGKFEFGQIAETNMIAGVSFFFFNVCMSIIMINLLMTIIIVSFEEAKEKAVHLVREYEIVDFMIERTLKFLGFRGRSSAVEPSGRTKQRTVQKQRDQGFVRPDDPYSYPGVRNKGKDMKELPEKVERMLEQINQLYFDGALNMNDRKWLAEMQKMKKAIKKRNLQLDDDNVD